jgi:signal recognition particle subunit SRP54
MIQKMGPLENLLGLVPGMPKLPSSATDGKSLKRVEAMILSMTPRERHNPDILNGRRRARIAKGSGTHVSELNDTLRRFEEMKRLMSRVAKSGNPMKQLQQMMGRR